MSEKLSPILELVLSPLRRSHFLSSTLTGHLRLTELPLRGLGLILQLDFCIKELLDDLEKTTVNL